MTQIPSIERTDDQIFRVRIEKGGPSAADSSSPHQVVFELFVDPTGPLHSVDFVSYRDGLRAPDLEFCNFKHVGSKNAYVRFDFVDRHRCALEHEYLLSVILRYFA